MPMVSESFRSKKVTITVKRRASTSVVELNPHVNKAQTGYRSGPLTQPEVTELGGTTWAASRSQLESNGYLIPSHSGARAFMVNDRDYKETSTKHGAVNAYVDFFPDSQTHYPTPWVGFLHVSDMNGSLLMPSVPTEAYSSSEAAKMVRDSVPAQSEVDLFLFLAELKDFPRMLQLANYVPKQGKEAGGSFLNYAFGIAPTVSDVRALAATIGGSIPLLERFRRGARRQLRRRRSSVLYEDNTAGVSWLRPFGADRQTNIDGVDLRYGYIVPGSSAGYDDTIEARIFRSTRKSRVLRTFATYEYFIPEPTGFGSRLQEYQKSAEQLVGSGLSAGALYDLTPFSWLADYFIDIGGLIRYQQVVASNSVVASKIGHVVEDRVHHEIGVSELRIADGATNRWRTENLRLLKSDSATLDYKMSRRRKGSPYSISPTWSLTKQQWGILGALGFALSPDVRLLK